MAMFLRLALAAVVMLAGTIASPTAEAAGYGRCGRCGTVVDVDRIWYDQHDRRGYDDHHDKGAQGAVVGAIIGGLLGNQVGGGSGKDVATVAGVVAGGLIGRNVDRRDGHRGGRGVEGTRLVVRMDRGYLQTIEVHGNPRLYKGDRVRVRDDRVALL